MLIYSQPVVDFTYLLDHINSAYHPYISDNRPVQIFKGGASAGKSVFLAQRDVYRLLSWPGYNLICVRKVGSTNHDSTFAELCKVIREWNLEELFRVNKSKGAEEIEALNGNKVLFRGLDDPEKIKSVTFETGPLICIRIEEASEISEDDFSSLELRLRGLSFIPKSVVMSFNPIDKNHWIKYRFFDIRLKDEEGFICESTYLDNEFLTEIDKKRIEKYKDIDYYYYMVYALNQWGDRTNTSVFHNIIVEDFEVLEHCYDRIRHGQDYGFNDANALVSIGWLDNEMYIYREFYYRRKTNIEFIKEVSQSNFPRDYVIIGDSAHPDKISEWNDYGYIVYPALKGPGSLQQGIDYLKSLPKIHIHETNCPNAAREFLNFKYKQLKDGTITDSFVELDDHTIAAARYAAEDYFLGKGGPTWVKST